MDNFRPLSLEDKPLFDKYIKVSDISSNFSSFGTMFSWRKQYPVLFLEKDNNLILKYDSEESIYIFPLGERNKAAIDFILNSEEDKPFEITNIEEKDKIFLEENYPDKFEFSTDMNIWDYVYSFEKLSELKGRKLSSKRNHINKFLLKYPDYKYEKISEENIDDCYKMSLEWCRLNDCGRSESLKNEACAVKEYFKYYKELNMVGGLIKADDKVIAFTFGEELNDDMFVVHVEKAFYDIDGAYPIINRDFVKNELSRYKWINREEDMGSEGLRKAKNSYYPDFMIKKYTAVLKKEDK
ncbi:MAG: DUF2156 domain-containing protein [Clostridia bacterium]|nr:DUF2156 domain-containing protein [Clostridia bacterium]